MILYAYVGFESLVVPASEISDAKSTLPRILPGLIVGVTILYLMLQTLCIGTLDGLADRANPISDAASLALGDTVGVAFLWVSVVSVLGVNAGTALVTPRRLAALGAGGGTQDFVYIAFSLWYTIVLDCVDRWSGTFFRVKRFV